MEKNILFYNTKLITHENEGNKISQWIINRALWQNNKNRNKNHRQVDLFEEKQKV